MVIITNISTLKTNANQFSPKEKNNIVPPSRFKRYIAETLRCRESSVSLVTSEIYHRVRWIKIKLRIVFFFNKYNAYVFQNDFYVQEVEWFLCYVLRRRNLFTSRPYYKFFGKLKKYIFSSYFKNEALKLIFQWYKQSMWMYYSTVQI